MVVGGSCIFCYKDPEGIKIDDASCPCGRGYVTKDGFFVNGRRVKEEKVPAKRDYEEHIRLCKKCRSGTHDCFWNDEPDDYNSFFVSGSGILLQVIRQYNEKHGGPHGEVRPAQFKNEAGFLVKSRVKYTEKMKEELRHQSAQAQRRDTAGEQRQHSSTTLRQDVLPSRQEPMARRDNQPIRRPTETGNDPRTSLPEGFDTLHVHDTQGYTTTTRSNPIFPREEGGRVPSAGQSIPGRSGNAAVPIYSSSPPAHIQPTTSFGRTSQTSSRQPMSQYGTNPTPVFSQYPAYSSSQMAPSSFATTSYTPVSRDTTRPERNTTIYRDERSRREESSDRTGPETSRRMEQLPLTRTIPQRDSLDDRNPERVSSTTQISSYQPSLSSSFDEPGLGPFTVRRDQPRSSQPWPEARPQDEPTAIFSATHPPRSYHEAIPSAESEMTQPITTSYTQRQPSERDSSPPRSRTGRRQLDDTLRDDRVSPAPTTRRRQELIREERPSYERRTSQPQTTRPSRMPPDDEDSDSRASPAPTAQRRRESVKEDRPAHVRRRSSIEQQTSRTNPRTSRPSLEGENDESRDQQPTSRVSEGRPRRDVPSRELTSRPSLEEEDEDPRDRQPVSRASEGRPRRDPSDRERVRRR